MPPAPPDDPGYEVTDGPGYEVLGGPPPTARKPPPKPVARRLPTPPAKPTAVPPRPRPKVTVVEADEPPRRRPRDADAEDAPKPKKKKKKPRDTVSQETNDWVMTWIGPALLTLVGMVLSCVAAVGMARAEEVNPLLYTVGVLIGQALLIPFIIVALMVIGTVFGIEYGSLGGAVLNLSAMIFFMYGLGLACDRFRVPFFMSQPILVLVSVGLFMTLFKLDMWETMVTTFCLSVMEYVTKLALLMVVLMLLDKAVRQRDGGDDLEPAGRPGQVDKWDGDEPPAGKADRGKRAGKGKRRPDPDDDPDDE